MELLNRIQQQLKAPKSHKNAFGNYNYRNCEDILEAVKPLLGDKGTLILSDEIVQVGDRHYVKASARLYDGTGDNHTGKFAEATAYARESLDKKGMDSAQITGAASSYARKYALNGLFLIDDTKDADSDETPSQTAKTAQPATKTAKVDEFSSMHLKASKERTRMLLKLLGHTDLKTKKDYEDAVFDLTGLMLNSENLEAINEKLAAQLDSGDAVENV